MTSSKPTQALLSEETVTWIDSLRVKYGVPGLAVAAVRGPKQPSHEQQSISDGLDSSGWQTQIETFGKRNRRGDPFDEDTIFAIASNSKVFVSLSIGILIERGTKLPNGQPLTWKTKVKDVLGDDWVLPDEYATNNAEMDDLAGMRLGMAVHHFGRQPLHAPMSPVQQIRNIRHFTKQTDLGRKFAYDSHCPLALSQVVSVVSGIPYHVFVEEEIFKPLGMVDSYCDSTKVLATNRAVDGFLRKGGDHAGSNETAILGKAEPVGWWTNDDGLWCLPMGGVAMTIRDAAKLIREYLDPHQLPAAVVKAIGEPVTPLPSDFHLRFAGSQAGPECYGRFQIVSSYRGYAVVWHNGNMPGQSTVIATVPSANVGVVVAINEGSMGGSMMAAIRNRLLDDLLGLQAADDHEARFIKPIMKALSTPARQSALTTSKTHHLSWAKIDAGTYYHPGYQSLRLVPFDRSAPEADAMIDIIRKKGWFYNLDSTCLVARMDKMWISHLVFRPLPLGVEEGTPVARPYEWLGYQVYDITDDNVQSTGDCVATCRGRGGAVFVDRGIAMLDGFQHAIVQDAAAIDETILDDVEKVEKAAVVWFGKVQ